MTALAFTAAMLLGGGLAVIAVTVAAMLAAAAAHADALDAAGDWEAHCDDALALADPVPSWWTWGTDKNGDPIIVTDAPAAAMARHPAGRDELATRRARRGGR